MRQRDATRERWVRTEAGGTSCRTVGCERGRFGVRVFAAILIGGAAEGGCYHFGIRVGCYFDVGLSTGRIAGDRKTAESP